MQRRVILREGYENNSVLEIKSKTEDGKSMTLYRAEVYSMMLMIFLNGTHYIDINKMEFYVDGVKQILPEIIDE